MTEFERLKKEFLSESSDLLDELEQLSLSLEGDDEDNNDVNKVFRIIHTLKGSSGMFGFSRAEDFLHEIEFFLEKVRGGKADVDDDTVSMLLLCSDLTRNVFNDIDGKDPHFAQRLESLWEMIHKVNGTKKNLEAVQTNSPVNTPTTPHNNEFEITISAKPNQEYHQDVLSSFIDGLRSLGSLVLLVNDEEVVGLDLITSEDKITLLLSTQMSEKDIREVTSFVKNDFDLVFGSSSDQATSDFEEEEESLESDFGDDFSDDFDADEESEKADDFDFEENTEQDSYSDFTAETIDESPNFDMAEEFMEQEVVIEPKETANVKRSKKKQEQADYAYLNNETDGQQEAHVKLNVSILENLMNLVGELVLTRNQLVELIQHDDDSNFVHPIQQLNRLVSSLQESAMQTRMQPIGLAWLKYPRLVRDLSNDLGKKIILNQRGNDTELDRQIIQIIQEPLLHLVRNAADHGLESPEERIKAGKPEAGNLNLSAYNEAGHIVIEISDDGKGIDVENIRTKLVNLGWMSKDQASKLTPSKLYDYLFEPGFSTKDVVTRVSGRGVGLDVVKKNIEKVGGTVDVTSKLGEGSRIKIKIPLTLAIVSALMVRSEAKIYAIPQLSVQELVLIDQNTAKNVEHIHKTLVYRLRNELLPLIFLTDVLETDSTKEYLGKQIVVTQNGDQRFGIVVDEVQNIQEIVVKPINRFLKQAKVYSGTTLVGGNQIVMILDTTGVAEKMQVLNITNQLHSDLSGNVVEADTRERTTLLLISIDNELKAIPLGMVDRLEEISAKNLEWLGDAPLIQYRGKVLRLMNASRESLKADALVYRIVVFSHGNSLIGIVVDNFEDVVEEVLDLERVSDKGGILGYSVIQGKSMEILDAGYYMSKAGKSLQTGTSSSSKKQKKVLLVDESSFMRNHLKLILHADGWKVTDIETASKAYAMIKNEPNEWPVVIVSNEMNEMTGSVFANILRDAKMLEKTVLVGCGQAIETNNGKDNFSFWIESPEQNHVLERTNKAWHKSQTNLNVLVGK